MKKKILIILLIIFVTLAIFLKIFNEKIIYFIYDIKYDNINRIEKDLAYNEETTLVGENSINVNDFNVTLSNIEYTEQKELNFNLKFSHSNSLSSVGYILRVYDKEYFLGDRFNGLTSLSSSEWILNQNSFYKRNFKDIEFGKNMLLNVIPQKYQEEILENENALIHRVHFELPEEFVINAPLNIVLFDINYQNVGSKDYHKVDKKLFEIKYKINNI